MYCAHGPFLLTQWKFYFKEKLIINSSENPTMQRSQLWGMNHLPLLSHKTSANKPGEKTMAYLKIKKSQHEDGPYPQWGGKSSEEGGTWKLGCRRERPTFFPGLSAAFMGFSL